MGPEATSSAQVRTEMGRVAGAIYLVSAVVTVAAILAPHSPQADIAGFWAMAALLGTVAAVLLRWPARLPAWAYQAVMALGSVLVACALYFNGERNGGPAAINEVLYIWIALYSGYFFTRAQMGAQLAGVGVTYAVALVAIHPGPTGVTRWLITVSMVGAAAWLVHGLKRGNDRLVARLGLEARRDWLTGVLNRQGFDERLEHELERARRTGLPFSLVMADIDDFKAINDAAGHGAGDRTLAAVGELLRGELRMIDAAARIGGDEFVLLLPATAADGARCAAERLRAAAAGVLTGDGSTLRISIGVAEFPADAGTADALLRAADESLYAAKRGAGGDSSPTRRAATADHLRV